MKEDESLVAQVERALADPERMIPSERERVREALAILKARFLRPDNTARITPE